MDIKRITDPGKAASILAIDDPLLKEQVLDRVGCSKAEWVQWIVSHLMRGDGKILRLWAIEEGGKIRAYMVAMNAVNPPLSRAIYILYQNFFGMTDDEGEPYHKELLQIVKEWAKECGATRLAIQTDYPRVNSRLGFIEEGHSMVLKL